jgi:hypothetical protein
MWIEMRIHHWEDLKRKKLTDEQLLDSQQWAADQAAQLQGAGMSNVIRRTAYALVQNLGQVLVISDWNGRFLLPGGKVEMVQVEDPIPAHGCAVLRAAVWDQLEVHVQESDAYLVATALATKAGKAPDLGDFIRDSVPGLDLYDSEAETIEMLSRSHHAPYQVNTYEVLRSSRSSRDVLLQQLPRVTAEGRIVAWMDTPAFVAQSYFPTYFERVFRSLQTTAR